MNADLTSPDVQIRLLIAEFVITIGQLEAQKAQLTQEKADLLAQLSAQVARSLVESPA